MKKGLSYVLTMLLIFNLLLIAGDDLEDKLSTYRGVNGEMYLRPMINTFGANLNSGMSHRTKVPKIGLNVSIDIIAMAAPISDDQRAFMAKDLDGPGSAEYKVPTIFGSKDTETLSNGFSPPQGIGDDIPLFPMAVPQLNVGSFFGTQASIRWMKFNVHEEIGDFSLVGFGLRHSMDQYIPLFPIHITAAFFTQSIELGNIMEGSSSYLGLNAGLKMGMLTLYGGFGIESAKFDLGYEYMEDGEVKDEVSFSIDAVNATRITVGFSIDMLILKLFADYNIGDQSTLCAGLGIGF